jgi:hypothetical protein
MLEVKQYKLSVKRILHFMSQMTLESGTSPITFTVTVSLVILLYFHLKRLIVFFLSINHYSEPRIEAVFVYNVEFGEVFDTVYI